MASLTEKTTPLGFENALHLLRRTTFRPTRARALALANLTPVQALDQLFNFTTPALPKPIRPTDGQPYFADFNNQGVSYDNTYDTNNGIDIANYWLYNSAKSDTIQWKLALFLHSIYITTYSSVSRSWDHAQLLLHYTNRNFKELAYKITINQQMIYYLGNYTNTKNNPNQNYAREFLELFTILKGIQVDAGNYTNYTELDVQQAARVLTGFSAIYAGDARMNYLDKGLSTNVAGHAPNPTNAGWTYATTNIPTGYCVLSQHDTGNKTFSSAFDGQTIVGSNSLTGAYTVYDELQAFINMVFAQPETAKNYARRLYRFFVKSEISQEVEDDIITPLANNLLSTQNSVTYNIEAAVRLLLQSVHFYDEEDTVARDEVFGGKVKSPMDLMLNFMNEANMTLVNPNSNPTHYYNFFNLHRVRIWQCGFLFQESVNVSGYPGYSDAPMYDKNWVTIATLNQRYNCGWVEQLLNGYNNNSYITRVDSPEFVRSSGYFTVPTDPTVLLSEMFEVFFPSAPQGLRYGYFENALLNGLSAANWAMTWNNWIADITNNTKKNAVRIPLDRLIKAIVKSTEYQVM